MMYPGSRYLHLQDSQVSLACMVKGRSSSRSLNFELRRSLPQHLTNRIRPAYGFLKSAYNPADDPTRDVEIRSAWGDVPAWLAGALRGEFAELDNWLRERSMHLDQLRQLPPVQELACYSSLQQALSSGPGWLDLFSGSRGLAKAIATTCFIPVQRTCSVSKYSRRFSGWSERKLSEVFLLVQFAAPFRQLLRRLGVQKSFLKVCHQLRSPKLGSYELVT